MVLRLKAKGISPVTAVQVRVWVRERSVILMNDAPVTVANQVCGGFRLSVARQQAFLIADHAYVTCSSQAATTGA